MVEILVQFQCLPYSLLSLSRRLQNAAVQSSALVVRPPCRSQQLVLIQEGEGRFSRQSFQPTRPRSASSQCAWPSPSESPRRGPRAPVSSPEVPALRFVVRNGGSPPLLACRPCPVCALRARDPSTPQVCRVQAATPSAVGLRSPVVPLQPRAREMPEPRANLPH